MITKMESIGEIIKARREELKMSQEELAKQLGYKSRSSINKIETASQNLPIKKISKIAEVLGTDPYKIVNWSTYEINNNYENYSKSFQSIGEFNTNNIDNIIKKLQDLNEPAQIKVLNYVEDLLANKKNFRNCKK